MREKGGLGGGGETQSDEKTEREKAGALEEKGGEQRSLR